MLAINESFTVARPFKGNSFPPCSEANPDRGAKERLRPFLRKQETMTDLGVVDTRKCI